MKRTDTPHISIVVPLYNEAEGLAAFHAALTAAIKAYDYEIIYCDDGSQDKTSTIAQNLAAKDARVRLVALSRNFGKEHALAAGIQQARGQAIMLVDGDGQHPVTRIPEFVAAWETGSKVVIGVRIADAHEGFVKHIGSKVFYGLFNKFSSSPLVPGSTDFLLIDQEVRRAFLSLPETDRITRGLIDWLGYDRTYIEFEALARQHGTATYTHRQLVALAANSFVSLTTLPLYIFGYIGAAITAIAFVLGGCVGLEQIVLGDPLHWKFTGTAMLSILVVFLVGIVLLSQGILGLYISHIHNQSKRRPLYIIDHDKSVKVQND